PQFRQSPWFHQALLTLDRTSAQEAFRSHCSSRQGSFLAQKYHHESPQSSSGRRSLPRRERVSWTTSDPSYEQKITEYSPRRARACEQQQPKVRLSANGV